MPLKPDLKNSYDLTYSLGQQISENIFHALYFTLFFKTALKNSNSMYMRKSQPNKHKRKILRPLPKQ